MPIGGDWEWIGLANSVIYDRPVTKHRRLKAMKAQHSSNSLFPNDLAVTA